MASSTYKTYGNIIALTAPANVKLGLNMAPQGVVDSVKPTSLLRDVISAGDQIVSVNGVDLSGRTDLADIVKIFVSFQAVPKHLTISKLCRTSTPSTADTTISAASNEPSPSRNFQSLVNHFMGKKENSPVARKRPPRSEEPQVTSPSSRSEESDAVAPDSRNFPGNKTTSTPPNKIDLPDDALQDAPVSKKEKLEEEPVTVNKLDILQETLKKEPESLGSVLESIYVLCSDRKNSKIFSTLDKFKPSTLQQEPWEDDPFKETCISCNFEWTFLGIRRKPRKFGNLLACKHCIKRRDYTLTDLRERFHIKQSQAMTIRHTTGTSNYGGVKYAFDVDNVLYYMEEQDGSVFRFICRASGRDKTPLAELLSKYRFDGEALKHTILKDAFQRASPKQIKTLTNRLLKQCASELKVMET